ncbi:Activating signal cointegrator 1 complex subunit 3 [Eumeta japonica]|uniref:Activating signal cointegrator 1 complex subunit 3 n=1 Tax=Eumeta variegata TaxID=151549 RepID=A0A4C1T9P9_EUMVA|nr:Activating signal cointegrator 1 complex subunit 3 [Eumeta japonica]
MCSKLRPGIDNKYTMHGGVTCCTTPRGFVPPLDLALLADVDAMVDYTAERGWLTTTLKVQQLMQSIIQARWFDESEFLTLPHVNASNVHLFYKIPHNYEHLTLPALKDICRKDYEKLDH